MLLRREGAVVAAHFSSALQRTRRSEHRQ